MIDETSSPSTAGSTTPGESAAEPVVAFCQQCGRALTASTRRQLGTSVFCEPCATARQAAGWTPVNPTAPTYPQDVPISGEPNPALAGFLGLIPGVGAMYNGQYAKGVIHLIVFVVLVSLADNLNWVFWWLVWGWIFYQAFEAYHTARARRDGLPLPDPFGWNELGDRLGFTRSSAPRPPRPARVTGFQPIPPMPSSPGPQPAQAAVITPPPSPVSPSPIPGPAAYTPQPPIAAASSTVHGHVPYTSTFTGYTDPSGAPMPPSGAPLVQPAPAPGRQTFPAGAVWLIALGILFLLGNILPAWHISGSWLIPVLLAVIAFWTGSRRILALEHGTGIPAGIRPSLAGALIGPALLLTVAVLLGLQAAYWIPLRHSWPALLIVWGALLLAQRAQNPAPVPAIPFIPSESPGTPVPPVTETSSRY